MQKEVGGSIGYFTTKEVWKDYDIDRNLAEHFLVHQNTFVPYGGNKFVKKDVVFLTPENYGTFTDCP